MNDHQHQSRAHTELSRRGLVVSAVAAGIVAGGRQPAGAAERGNGTPGHASTTTPPAPASGKPSAFPRYAVPQYQLTVPGESVVSDRVDRPVAPGIVLTSFDTFGRDSGWTRVHVLNADLGDASVGVDLVADRVSQARPLVQAANAQQAVAAVNGDYFDITETYAAEGPEIMAGHLRKGTDAHTTVATIGADRVARLADLVLTGTATVAGTSYPLAALNSPSVPADGIAAYTPEWGTGDRTLIQDAGPWTELVVAGGRVTAVHAQITTTAVPDGGLVVMGRGAAAAKLATAAPGDAVMVTFAPSSDAPVALRTALGSGSVLVRGGTSVDFPPSTGNDEAKPRTAIAWPAGGHRLLLVAVDGSAGFSAGLSFDETAELLVRLGAADGFMLDGGGSTEIVARRAGDTAVSIVNTPSDGSERPVPDGVGLFAARGSGQLRGLDVRPRADRVVPGLTLDVGVAGYDETWAPVGVARHPVDWSAVPGSLGRTRDGVFTARNPGAGRLTARSGRADGAFDLRVVGELHRLAFSDRTLTLDPGTSAAVSLTGFDADGFDAPVAPRDTALDYDPSMISVKDAGDGTFTVTGGDAPGGSTTTITATVQGVTAELPVTVGLLAVPLAEFEPAEGWTVTSARGSASVSVTAAGDRPGAAVGNQALTLSYDFTGQSSTSAAYAVAKAPITLPVGTKKLSLWVNGDGQGHWLRAMMSSQSTTNVPFTFAEVVDWTGWQQVVGDLPAGFSDPITLSRVYYVETSQTNKNAGAIELDALAALVGQQAAGDNRPPQPDPYVVEQNGLPEQRWTFSVLSDLHISAAAGLDSFSGRQAVAALQQVVASEPDFVLINGDFVDDDNPVDFDLANGLLRDHVPAGLPVYWTPGNHEAGLSATGGIDEFLARTGRPNKQVFDHKGTRFILLDSHTGDMRTSDWDQVPLLQQQLKDAAEDRSVTGVVVSFHHPLVDPSGAAASQLSDQLEAALIKQWLADFRETSGKPIALFNGHAHTAAVGRADGVLEVNTPAVGKTPYSSPDQGGFFGWMHVAVDPRPARIRAGQPSPETREWLQAVSCPLIDGIDLTAPDTITVGSSSVVSATGITSEFGLRFPLRFPASVTWGGGDGLVVAESAVQARAARRRPGTRAVLDLSSSTLTAVRAGSVTLTVSSGGLKGTATVTLS